jgi:excisionase family DNA binding protein
MARVVHASGMKLNTTDIQQAGTNLVTATAFAESIGVSLRTVRKWQTRKVIPFVKIGKVVRINPQKANAHVQAHFEHRAIGQAA